MNHFRIQDVIARLGKVSLQNTVTILQVLYVSSKALAEDGDMEMQELSHLLESMLTQARYGKKGEIKNLRDKPDIDDQVGCLEACEVINDLCFDEIQLTGRDSTEDLIKVSV